MLKHILLCHYRQLQRIGDDQRVSAPHKKGLRALLIKIVVRFFTKSIINDISINFNRIDYTQKITYIYMFRHFNQSKYI